MVGRNYISCEWVEAQDRVIIAIKVNKLLIINMNNQNQTETPKVKMIEGMLRRRLIQREIR